jgi:hypothetical protein
MRGPPQEYVEPKWAQISETEWVLEDLRDGGVRVVLENGAWHLRGLTVAGDWRAKLPLGYGDEHRAMRVVEEIVGHYASSGYVLDATVRQPLDDSYGRNPNPRRRR